MKNTLKLLVPVIALIFVGCASSSEKSCSKNEGCSSVKKEKSSDDSKEVRKIQY